MKIRIKNNGLRFRLTKSEVALFAEEGMVTEKVQIGGTSLTYTLQRKSGNAITASFVNNVITVVMPENMANEWTATDKVGFGGMNGDLHLLIEKDFTCLDNVDEDQSDNYPNPLAEKLYEQRN
ncbi:DUF7009 family protein [Mucilaginibacter glaciei]|uniref:Uncharacterized protein n=1 Tax=Mucilaginibacter glaciei TaxID=2772109 RepID=A0A926NQG1_9SPHI|nr:hypothetical protein [Mucilaginibacter glaciei]MBD1391995.1 hypothetical protein [Mucilaginibacter glaciei]